ncbi:class Ib ribonucleoside-diphosphate reductase assembly flavoprotein NrdI [Providencia burhodogranariea]|uniref:Protein NrdI n=1 Tax=Providencia burhodogranariea DSM 19968 TaxID=1141662 RepID=K8WZ39_9GAMM|nr:class Ib ribonucleoside-diphosphate reductase assembly flavoprotein NrdI [Providencia burhodogranariea]EKT61470.1 NrdI protein [Providencia burhodogranariea DSM 19968]
MQTESLIYFSSRSGNCHRFVEKVGLPATRLPIGDEQSNIIATAPFVLLLPTYGGGGTLGAVPKEVIRFLNIESNRLLIRGVIAAGNTNFGEAYAIAGDIIASKCQVPYLYRFELLGTERDVQRVRDGLNTFWQKKHN